MKERINNCKIELTRLNLDELVSMWHYIQERKTQAESELKSVEVEIERRHSPELMGSYEEEVA